MSRAWQPSSDFRDDRSAAIPLGCRLRRYDPSPELAIFRHLATRTTATEIGTACTMSPGEVRGRLVMLESQRLIAGRSGKTAGERTPRRVYVITAEGRRKAGVSDARSMKIQAPTISRI